MFELTPKQKRQARTTALQAIYAEELDGSKPETTYEHMMDRENLPEDAVLQYSRHLCDLTFVHAPEMDNLIQKKSKNWDFERITLMDKLILRMSLAEMLYENEVPPKVSIAEGVEIAKEFSTEDSSSFINGILDSVYNDMIKGKEKTV